MVFLGIDWATEKHDICVLAEDGTRLSEFTITNDMTGFQQLQTALTASETVRVNIERSHGLLVEWLVSCGFSVYMTPPNILAHRRPRRAKDDRGDAYLLASLLRLGDPDVRPIAQQSSTVVHLRQLASAYDMVLQQQRQLANRLIHVLRLYYPAVLQVFPIPTTLICLAFLETYPTPELARALSVNDLEAFLKKQQYRYLGQLPRRYSTLQAPAPTARVVEGYLATLRILIPMLRSLHHERTRLTKEMVRVFNSHPDAVWWRTIPGASGTTYLSTPPGLDWG